MERLPNDVTELQVNIRLMTNLRTEDVDESLKLILQGADVRFVHPETGQTLLHAAVLAGQPLQVGLEKVYICFYFGVYIYKKCIYYLFELSN